MTAGAPAVRQAAASSTPAQALAIAPVAHLPRMRFSRQAGFRTWTSEACRVMA
jgi:hypothetical protein